MNCNLWFVLSETDGNGYFRAWPSLKDYLHFFNIVYYN